MQRAIHVGNGKRVYIARTAQEGGRPVYFGSGGAGERVTIVNEISAADEVVSVYGGPNQEAPLAYDRAYGAAAKSHQNEERGIGEEAIAGIVSDFSRPKRRRVAMGRSRESGIPWIVYLVLGCVAWVALAFAAIFGAVEGIATGGGFVLLLLTPLMGPLFGVVAGAFLKTLGWLMR